MIRWWPPPPSPVKTKLQTKKTRILEGVHLVMHTSLYFASPLQHSPCLYLTSHVRNGVVSCTVRILHNEIKIPLTLRATSLTFNNFTLCPHCIYVFCICLRTNSDLCYLQYKLIGFYNRDEKCLLRGTNWVFK
jgi:hypothetical protein